MAFRNEEPNRPSSINRFSPYHPYECENCIESSCLDYPVMSTITPTSPWIITSSHTDHFFSAYDSEGDLVKPRKKYDNYSGYFKRNNQDIHAVGPITLGHTPCRYKLNLSGTDPIVEVCGNTNLDGTYYQFSNNIGDFLIADSVRISNTSICPEFAGSLSSCSLDLDLLRFSWSFLLAADGNGPYIPEAYGDDYHPRLLAYGVLHSNYTTSFSNLLGYYIAEIGRFTGSWRWSTLNRPFPIDFDEDLGLIDGGDLDGRTLDTITFNFIDRNLFNDGKITYSLEDSYSFSGTTITLTATDSNEFYRGNKKYKRGEVSGTCCSSGGVVIDPPGEGGGTGTYTEPCIDDDGTSYFLCYNSNTAYKYQEINRTGKINISGVKSIDLDVDEYDIEYKHCKKCENLNDTFLINRFGLNDGNAFYSSWFGRTPTNFLCNTCDASIANVRFEFRHYYYGYPSRDEIVELILLANFYIPLTDYYDDVAYISNNAINLIHYKKVINQTTWTDMRLDGINPADNIYVTEFDGLDIDFTFSDSISYNFDNGETIDWSRCDFENATMNVVFPSLTNKNFSKRGGYYCSTWVCSPGYYGYSPGDASWDAECSSGTFSTQRTLY